MEYNDEVSGIIEVDAEGNAHCGNILFAKPMGVYKGCQCSISKYWDNVMDYGRTYPYFVTSPKKIDYSLTGIVEEAEDGRLHVGKYVLPYTNPPIVTKGAAIIIKQIHPIVKKGTEYFGVVTDFTQYGVESKDVIPFWACFLVDTNVLIDCPSLFDHIKESNPVIIVNHVITELDGLKKSPDEKTHQAAQKANTQILEASKQGKVVFVSTRPPYEPFLSPYSMDQKILSAAFLKRFQDTTVVLISSDKNMLLLAESNGVKGITLEDFLYGNYTIEANNPIPEPQPEAEQDHRPDSGQDVLSIDPISKVSQYKVNFEKDLEIKYTEYSQLYKQLFQSAIGESLEVDDEKLSPTEIETRRKINTFIDASSLSLLILYDCFFHEMLFTNWNWEKDKADLEKSGFSYRNHTSEEIFNSLSIINFDAVCLLFDNLECPLGIKETLRSSLYNKQKDAFVKTLNGLTCDLSILHFYSDYVSLLLGTIIGMFCDPQTVYDFIFHCDYGKLTEVFKKSVPSSFKEDMEGGRNGKNEHSSSASEDYLAEIDSGIIQTLKTTNSVLDELNTKGRFFPFEKKYVDRLLLNPDFQPYWERIKATQPNEIPAGQGEDVNVEFHFEVPRDVFDPQKRVLDDTIYVHSINPAVYTEPNSVETFQKLFDYVLKWGIIKDKADQGAMLTLLTGYHIQGAANNAKWCCDKYMPRVLYYIVKYLSKSSSKYESLESVDFYSDNIIIQDKIESDLYSIRKGSNTSQIVNNSIPVEIKRALHNLYPSLFIDTDEQ